jgi:predicted RNase H-like HicB family nuclease
VTQGATRLEAISNAEEAIAAYLDSLRERGEAIPPAINEELVDVAV